MVDLVRFFLPFVTLVGGAWLVLIVISLAVVGFGRKGIVGVVGAMHVGFLKRNALALVFVIALVATGGSLFYSEVAGFAPCKLCWLQRIFMYPLVPLGAVAIGTKDKGFASYGIVMSVIGGSIAGYHYLLQRGLVGHITECTTVGYSVSCSDNFVLSYGYITIPMMALTAFGLITMLMFVKLQK